MSNISHQSSCEPSSSSTECAQSNARAWPFPLLAASVCGSTGTRDYDFQRLLTFYRLLLAVGTSRIGIAKWALIMR